MFLLGIHEHEAEELREFVHEVLAQLLFRFTYDRLDIFWQLHKVVGLVPDDPDQVSDGVEVVLPICVEFLDDQSVNSLSPRILDDVVLQCKILKFLKFVVINKSLHVVAKFIDEGEFPGGIPKIKVFADAFYAWWLHLVDQMVHEILQSHVIIDHLDSCIRLLHQYHVFDCLFNRFVLSVSVEQFTTAMYVVEQGGNHKVHGAVVDFLAFDVFY